jgi:hypothetical protein
MNKRLALMTTMVVLVAFGLGAAPALTGAAQAPSPKPAPQAQAQTQASMAEMMKMHEQMMAEMKASEAKLEALVKDMNAAAGEARLNALAAVVNELVRQNRAMHEHMDHMHHMMGGHGMMMHR